MARKTPKKLLPLQERLGYTFNDIDLLNAAVTHVSASGGVVEASYQRLEFLGDRVLGIAIAEMLFAEFPSASEGELSQRLSELVRRETCAEVAAAWEVGPALRLGEGEMHLGVRRNQAILADVCESIIGAVFLDGGYEQSKALIERSFLERLKAPRRPLRDPKSALQEWAQAQGLPTPKYTVAEQVGPDHAPRFHIVVRVKGTEMGFGVGSSKRVAEQDAARSILVREGVWTEETHVT